MKFPCYVHLALNVEFYFNNKFPCNVWLTSRIDWKINRIAKHGKKTSWKNKKVSPKSSVSSSQIHKYAEIALQNKEGEEKEYFVCPHKPSIRKFICYYQSAFYMDK